MQHLVLTSPADGGADMLPHAATPCRTSRSRPYEVTSYAVPARKRLARRKPRVAKTAVPQHKNIAAPAAAKYVNTQVYSDPNIESEQSSTVLSADVLAQRNAHNSSSIGSTSPSATLFGALVQSALQQATNQLQSTAEQVNKLTKGFQPRPEGYPPGLIPVGPSFALIWLARRLNPS